MTTTQPIRGVTSTNSAWAVSFVAREEEGARMTLTILEEEMGRSSGVCVYDVSVYAMCDGVLSVMCVSV